MISSTIKNFPIQKLNLIYQSSLVAGFFLIFFSNFDVYAPLAGLLPIEPLIWIVLFLGGSLLLSASILKKGLPYGLTLWCAGYLLISYFYFWLFFAPSLAAEELDTRLRSVIFIFMAMLTFSRSEQMVTWARKMAIVVGLIGVANNLYEFPNPGVFAGLNLTGRPAGWYVNSNNCGVALMESMILGMGVLPPIYRIPYALVMGVGIFITFSRASLLGWIIVMMIFTVTGMFPRREVFRWLTITVVSAVVIAICVGSFLNIDNLQAMGILNANTANRLSQILGESSADKGLDDSALARLLVIQIAWKMFTNSPLIGNGLASTEALDVGGLVDHPISTHNTYIYLLADHGILGAFIYPLILCASAYPFKSEHQTTNFAFILFMAMWGLFAHTILVLRFHLITFALVASMNQPSRLPRSHQRS